jgi:UDP-N-acetylglucosamine--N-acetylmuramyl-(pentapeptide) pyrophosphoryl-undecaprenol N-acetylglucosamine transferase
MTNYLLAGGGTAGHVNPLLALADAISAQSTKNKVFALGTAEGLEQDLVPARGYPLLTVQKLPFPRALNRYAFGFPLNLVKAIRECESHIRNNDIDVVVGFGGYASAPAYLAARKLGVPIVVHEANALPGWANKLGHRFSAATGVTFASTPLRGAKHVGMPLRKEIEAICNGGDKASAREFFNLNPKSTTLLVTGGSLGAKRINLAIESSRAVLSAAGIQVLHIIGGKSDLDELREKEYVRIRYCNRMDQAILASDFAISRAGASTVSEFAAAGLAAAYVPYPVGNGEQKLNVAGLISAGGGLLILDDAFTPELVSSEIVPLLSNSKELTKMSNCAKSYGIKDGTKNLMNLVQGVLDVRPESSGA